MEKVQERSMLKFVLLSIFTGNIYRLYFYYKLSLDVNAVCEDDGKETESYLIATILGILTFGLYFRYWEYKLAQRLCANAPRYGFKMAETGKDIVVLGVFSAGYISGWELIKNINKIGEVYNQYGKQGIAGANNMGGMAE